MLVELAAEGDGEVGRGVGGGVGGEEAFPAVEGGAPALTDLHVLEAGLHTAAREINSRSATTSP